MMSATDEHEFTRLKTFLSFDYDPSQTRLNSLIRLYLRSSVADILLQVLIKPTHHVFVP